MEQQTHDSVSHYKPKQFGTHPHKEELDITCLKYLTIIQESTWGYWNTAVMLRAVGEGVGERGLWFFE